MRRLLIALLLVSGASPALAQVTRVQGVTIAGTTGTGTVTVTLPSNVTIGNQVLVGVKMGEPESLTAGMVTNAGTAETWTLDVHENNAVDATFGFYSTTVTANQSLAITFNPVGTTRLIIGAVELSGVGAYGGVTAALASGSGTAVTSGAFTPGAATGVAIAVILSSQAQTWEADYATNAAEDATGRGAMAYDIDPPANSNTVTSTQASAAWAIKAAWYAASGGGGATCSGGILTLGAGKPCE